MAESKVELKAVLTEKKGGQFSLVWAPMTSGEARTSGPTPEKDGFRCSE